MHPGAGSWWRSFGLAALAVGLAACVPMSQEELPNGDHVVTSYVRLQGLTEARDDNLWAARQVCRGGVVLIDERTGIDENGTWDRLVYGCVASRADRADEKDK